MQFQDDLKLVLDWKVKGYCAKRTTSPTAGYGWIRPEGKMHPGYVSGGPMELLSPRYADQGATYFWLLGLTPQSSDAIIRIDELACKPCGEWPTIRVAQFFSNHVGRIWQENLLREYQECWAAIDAGRIWEGLTDEESASRAALLDLAETPESNFAPVAGQAATVADAVQAFFDCPLGK